MPAEAQQASPADGKAAAGSGGQQTTLGKHPAESGAVAPLPSSMALPNAVVQRLIKSKLPDGVMLHKDARAAFNKSTSIFILMLTTIASDISREAKRSTVTGQDVLNALKELEFDDLVEQLEVCLAAFREADKARTLAQRAKRAKTSGAAGGGEEAAADDDAEAEDDGEADEAEEAAEQEVADEQEQEESSPAAQ